MNILVYLKIVMFVLQSKERYGYLYEKHSFEST